MPKMIFINLPVKDLAASTRFYEAIGCTKNPEFSNDDVSSMMWSDEITFMLLKHAYFSTFITRPIADAHAATGVLIALSMDSKAAVDEINKTAADNGGRGDIRDLQDLGFMYSRAFEDPDGNIFEPVWMDMNAAMAEE
ncbi:VOC family protein [Pelagibacterium lacus]|uniref:Lactoylglutathione lyase n=1 Tax=Pelagibacterium lacus TaxID=2282655 RepID=A0A369W2M8_9HYPH|nr:VOC family protein [Pelagibacterium lacus]RDE08125.1 lactoylglutathione lyase [Pelagibacterium lacus]